MNCKASTVAALTLCSVCFGASVQAEGKNVNLDAAAPVATPLGIELQPLGVGQGSTMRGTAQFGSMPIFDVGFANDKGSTLYTFDGDKPGKSICVGECETKWPPALAQPNAKPVANWSLIKRSDGSLQWAYLGKPLYTSVLDKGPGSVGGVLVARGGRPGRGRGEGETKVAAAPEMPPEWHAAIFSPAKQIITPPGISIREVGDANGMVLQDAREMTIYTFNGDPNRDGTTCAKGGNCGATWLPVVAPQAAVNSIGEFNPILRKDGIRQWAFRGRPLYTFAGDLAPGYANGANLDRQRQVALVTSYYLPAEVRIGETIGRGKVLTTERGQTLYRRDAHAYQTGGGHSLRNGLVIRPAVGREIGVDGCNETCLKEWHPLVAGVEAQPSGYWEIVPRKDGSRQWAYKGFPLYTYDKDKRPGDTNGIDLYDMMLSDDPTVVNTVGTEQVGVATLYWTFAMP